MNVRTQSQSASVERKSESVSGWNIAAVFDGHGHERHERHRGQRQSVAVRPQLPRDLPDEQHRPEQQEHVERRRGAVGVAEPELSGHPVDEAGDEVEAGRRVVLADAVRELPAGDEAVGVGDVVGRVVPEARRVVGGVPEADHGDEGAERPEQPVGGDPAGGRPASQPASSHRSHPCRSRRRGRAACAGGSSGRPVRCGARRTRGRARSGRPRAAPRGRGSAPSR